VSRILGVLIAVLIWVTGSGVAHASGPISRAQLEQMFSGMRSSAPWDVDGPLLWGYFFTSPDRKSVDRAGEILVGQGYRLVEIHRKGGVWWLHVERVERHTVDSLDARNTEFYAFAKQEGLATYDGMDVGSAP
jgi:hypothetical protein